MGHRTVKRVPIDFGWPIDEVWQGYLTPEWLHEEECARCDGSGSSPRAAELHDLWYGKVPFDPASKGSTALTSETPEVRALAEWNIGRSPDFYGTGDTAIVREARRLAAHFNRYWMHHVDQDDVDALIAEGRLHDLTHTCTKGDGWKPRDPMPTVTAADVNLWSLAGFGHDSINSWVVIKAKCEREGVSPTCSACDGHGHAEKWGGQRAVAEAWQRVEPPTGDGWQLWGTTSEGNPASPVFPSAEDLADWCAEHATAFADIKLTRAQWLASFLADTTDVDTLAVGGAGIGLTVIGASKP